MNAVAIFYLIDLLINALCVCVYVRVKVNQTACVFQLCCE